VMKKGRVVKGGLWGHQRKWWFLRNFVKLLVTGYGGGKTNVLCKRMLALALQNSPAPCAIVSPTFPLARETTIVTLEELLTGKEKMLKGFKWTHNKSEHVFRIRYGLKVRARIIIYSGEDPERLRGPNLGAVGIDEPFIQDVEVFKQMVARIRDPRARHHELNCTGTPESLNWGYDLAEGDLKDKYDVGIVQASTHANLAVGPEYAERLEKQYATRERQAYVHGLFVNLASGQVYYAFDKRKNVLVHDRPKENGELGAGMDFGAARNYASMAAVVFWTDGYRMHVLKEYEQMHSDTPFMCETLEEDWRGDRQGLERLVDVYPDASGQARQSASGLTDFHALAEAGYTIGAKSVNPGRRDRYNRVNYMLESGRLTIDPECRKLISYLAQHTHEEMNKQKQMTHLLDALGYPVCYLFPAEDPAMQVVPIM